MRRRLFRVVFVLGLAIWLLTGALWLLSRRPHRFQSLQWQKQPAQLFLGASNGRNGITFLILRDNAKHQWERLFTRGGATAQVGSNEIYLQFPHVFVIVLMLPVALLESAFALGISVVAISHIHREIVTNADHAMKWMSR